MKLTTRSVQNVQVVFDTGSHSLLADESRGVGDGAGPDPYALLLSA